jgi:hypothetical protein
MFFVFLAQTKLELYQSHVSNIFENFSFSSTDLSLVLVVLFISL